VPGLAHGRSGLVSPAPRLPSGICARASRTAFARSPPQIGRILPARVEQSVALQRAFMLDVHMMATTGGRERTEAEYRILLDAAGFRVIKVVPTQSEMSVVECARV
jgi:hypothetical protein